ncbi:MAG: hypothetical protein JRJ87_05060 [Deltaproteobacteria bacterium]|nr:hypothetical protein [Deltaproteobacteria bacterium]
MRHITIMSVSFAMLLFAVRPCRAAEEADKPAPKVAVLDLQGHGVPAETASVLSGILLSGLSEGGGIDMLGKADLGKMLSLEEAKQLVGCPPEDPRCVTEHGHALGNAILIWGSVGKVGDRVVISAAAVDIQAGTTLGRGSISVDANDGEEMIEATRELAARLRAMLGLESKATWQPIMAASVRTGGNFAGYVGGDGSLDIWNTSIEVEAGFFIYQWLLLYLQIGMTIGSGTDINDKNYNAYFVPAVVGVKFRFVREWLTPYCGIGFGFGFLDLDNQGGVFTLQLVAGMEISPPGWRRFGFLVEGGFNLNEPFKSKDLTQLGGRAHIGVIYRF